MSLKLNASNATLCHVSCGGKCPECKFQAGLSILVRVMDDQDYLGYDESIDALMRGNNGHAGLR